MVFGALPALSVANIQSPNQSQLKVTDSLVAYAAVSKTFTGWKKVNGKVYYYVKGKKASGFKTIKGKTYYFKKGVSQKSFQKIGKRVYYFRKVGTGKYAMAQGWREIGSSKYYFKKIATNRYAVTTGWRTIAGKRYHFGSTGKLTVAKAEDGYVVNIDGVWRHFNKDGSFDATRHILKYGKFKMGAYAYLAWDDDVEPMNYSRKKEEYLQMYIHRGHLRDIEKIQAIIDRYYAPGFSTLPMSIVEQIWEDYLSIDFDNIPVDSVKTTNWTWNHMLKRAPRIAANLLGQYIWNFYGAIYE
jgi:hypothetical protein